MSEMIGGDFELKLLLGAWRCVNGGKRLTRSVKEEEDKNDDSCYLYTKVVGYESAHAG
jgi:hypothetical protein